MITAYDPNPLPVKYMSFASYEGATVEYLYNCVSDKTAVAPSNAIPKEPIAEWSSLSDAPLDGELVVVLMGDWFECHFCSFRLVE